MKKRLILTACLAFAMGLGVAVGAHHAPVAKSEAAGEKTVYCKVDKAWWTEADAAVGAYYWGGTGGPAWPGVRMTAVENDVDVWKITIPSGHTSIIFTRVNGGTGAVSDWGAKTGDLTIPTDSKNLYLITSESPVWGDPGVAGEWQTTPYVEPTAPSVYSYSLNGAAAVDMTISGGEAVSASLSFKAGDELTFKKDDAALAVTAKDDDLYTKVEVVDSKLVFVQDYTGILYLDIATNKLWAGEIDSGYYLNGSANSWNLKHAIKAVEQTDEVTGDPNGVFEAKGVTLAANAEVKFIEMIHETKEPSWKNIDSEKLHIGEGVSASLTEGETPNLKIANAGTYDFYYNSTNGWYSIENPNYEEVYTVKVGETTYNTKLNTGTEWMIDAIDIPLTAGQSVAIYKDGVLDSTFARKAVGNNNLDADGKVIANSSAAQIYFDLSARTLFVGGLGEVGGYHLLVNNNLVAMTENTSPLDPSFAEYYSELISFKTNDTVKFLDKSGNAEDHCAHTFVITKFNEGCEPAGTFSTAQAATQGVLVALQDVDLKIYLKLKTGEDEIYYNTVAPEVAEARDWAKGFTDSIGGVCKWDNTTDLEALAEAWQAKVTSYGLLDVKVQNVLKAATDKDSINELKAFVLMYNYVAGKYGDQLGEGYNFLGKTLSAPLNPAVDYTLASSDNNIMIIVIASAVALSMAMATLIIIKKKKFSK